MGWLLLAIAALIVFSFVYLRGENLAYLDTNIIPRPVGEPSAAHQDVIDRLDDFGRAGESVSRRDRIPAIRQFMDSMSEGKAFESEFRPVDTGSLRGEWVLGPGVDSRRRVLYIHGGAWFAGSPLSHRVITDRLSRLLNAAVFSLDYRLLPENKRIDGILDCQNAYRWILGNGPDGADGLDFLLVAGDSAGGSLTLMTIAWARDEGLRAADAAVALSPSTDVTMTSPSLITNIPTDPMLGPGFGKLLRMPKIILWWMNWLSNRLPPSDPRVSPLRGDLSGLPPVLVHVSEAEMLLDDARRYVSKAQAAGSPVELQSWPHMVHVWHIFSPELPEAEDAFENIAEFLQTVEQGGEHKEAA
jgi:acetyl esterase/lipase